MHFDIKTINSENFNKYGQFINNNLSSEPDIKTEHVTFWKTQASVLFGENLEVGVLKVKNQDMVFSELENHFETPTMLIGLKGSFVLPVAPPKDKIPPANEIEVFKVNEGQSVVLKETCWHGTTYPLSEAEITLLVIFKQGTLEKDTVFEKLDEKCSIDIRS